jgi:hypothetical protein
MFGIRVTVWPSDLHFRPASLIPQIEFFGIANVSAHLPFPSPSSWDIIRYL